LTLFQIALLSSPVGASSAPLRSSLDDVFAIALLNVFGWVSGCDGVIAS
jgi:hypothetical protein